MAKKTVSGFHFLPGAMTTLLQGDEPEVGKNSSQGIPDPGGRVRIIYSMNRHNRTGYSLKAGEEFPGSSKGSRLFPHHEMLFMITREGIIRSR